MIFVIASIVPYLIPIKTVKKDNLKPFNESKYQNIDNIKVHYRMWTPQTKQAKGKVLMVHGFGSSTFSWRNNITDLVNEGYMVVAVDLPGFGYSDKSKAIDHSQKNRSKILWQLLDTIDLTLEDNNKQLSWTLVGHSIGGGTISAMTMDKPDRTEKILLISGALFDNSPSLVSNLLYYPPLKRTLKVALDNYIINYKNIENYLGSAYGRIPSREEVLGYLKPLATTGPSDFITDLVITAKSEPVERLNVNTVPILYIAGENDTVVPKDQTVTLKKIISRVEIITIKEAAHCSMETDSDEFNNILLHFVKN